MIMCDEVIESCDKDADAEAKSNNEGKPYDETKTVPTNFNEKNITCKTQNFYISLPFSLTAITLFIAVSIYCYLVKYRTEQKHYHFNSQITS